MTEQTERDRVEAPAPSGGAGWHCGNGGLTAQLVLLLVADRHVQMDSDTIAHLEILVQNAGPEFATDLINRMKHYAEVPF